jgi:hypothetical protein
MIFNPKISPYCSQIFYISVPHKGSKYVGGFKVIFKYKLSGENVVHFVGMSVA